MAYGRYGFPCVDEFVDQPYGVFIDANVVGIYRAAWNDQCVEVAGFNPLVKRQIGINDFVFVGVINKRLYE